MTIRTLILEPGLVVALRQGFEQLADRDGQPILDTATKAPIWVAEALVPGSVRFASAPADGTLPEDRPAQLRLRVIGADPGVSDGAVRLSGLVKASTWYNPRARGKAARSALTITAERVERAAGQAPTLRGGLPCIVPADVPLTLWGISPRTTSRLAIADVAFDASGSYAVDGVAEIMVRQEVDADLIGRRVRPVGLRGFYVMPDAEDVSARSKAELLLVAAGFEAAGQSQQPFNGKGSRKSEPAPVEQPAEQPAA